MSIEEISPEELAKLFQECKEALAQGFDKHNRDGAASCWEQTPQEERQVIVAATRMALLELAAAQQEHSRRYFAKPGEADWGC